MLQGLGTYLGHGYIIIVSVAVKMTRIFNNALLLCIAHIPTWYHQKSILSIIFTKKCRSQAL